MMTKMTMTFLVGLVLLLLSAPTAMAGSIDGKGVVCPYSGGAYAFWFEDNKALHHQVEGHAIKTFYTWVPYEEVGTEYIKIDGWTAQISRRTLIHSGNQCYLVKNPLELNQELQAIIDAAKAKNKL